jgi:hypothetical protein
VRVFAARFPASGCDASAEAIVAAGVAQGVLTLPAAQGELSSGVDCRIVFLYRDPAEALSFALIAGNDPATWAAEWVSAHTDLLAALKRYRAQCVLVNAGGLDAGALSGALGARWGLKPEGLAIQEESLPALEALLAAQHALGLPDLDATAEYLGALALPLPRQQRGPPSLEEATSAYFVQREKLLTERDEHRARLDELTCQQGAAEKLAAQYKSEAEEHKGENELLLSQLHQVQEELESCFLKVRDLEQDLGKGKALQEETEKLAADRQAQAEQANTAKAAAEKLAAERQAQIEQANTAKAAAEKLAAQYKSEAEEHKGESELLLSQLHQVQEELESYFLKARDLEQDLGKSKALQEETEKKLQNQKSQLAQVRTKKQALEAQAKKLRARVAGLEPAQAQAEQSSEVPHGNPEGPTGDPDTWEVSPEPDESVDVSTAPASVEAASTLVVHAEAVTTGAAPAPEQGGSSPAKTGLVSDLFRRKPRSLKVRPENAALIRESDLFDEVWYLQTNPDVAAAGFDAAEHYLAFGASEKRDPSAAFSSVRYLELYPDVGARKMNPLLHYLRHGKSEGRKIAPAKDG